MFGFVGGASPRRDVDMTLGALFAAGVTGVVLLSSFLLVVLTRRLFRALPIGDIILRRRHTAVILRALAAGIEAGQTLPSLLARLAPGYPRPWVKRRLTKSKNRVERGEDWCEALRVEGLLGRSDAAVLRSAERVGNLSWAMRETAASGERRLSYRFQAVGQVLQPLVVIAMGILVLLFALTYFRPLITLIDAVAGMTE